VVERCEQAGMELYWWNPMYDDYDKPAASARLWEANGLPCLNGGGNVGTAAWVLTHAALGKRRIGLVGIDLGYAPGTRTRRPSISRSSSSSWELGIARPSFTPRIP